MKREYICINLNNLEKAPFQHKEIMISPEQRSDRGGTWREQWNSNRLPLRDHCFLFLPDRLALADPLAMEGRKRRRARSRRSHLRRRFDASVIRGASSRASPSPVTLGLAISRRMQC